jgi:predicted RNA-binding Zn ribbon-like protein
VLFAHDTLAGLACAIDLVNTEDESDDSLVDVAALKQFFDSHVLTGRFEGSPSELGSVRDLRSQLRAVWTAATASTGTSADEVAAIVNQLLERADARPWLSNHDDWDWHFHATASDAPLQHRIAAVSAMAFADLVRLQELDRLRICDAPDCQAVLVDLSRNHSRRYCDTGNCGNRQHVAAYRARRREPPSL